MPTLAEMDLAALRAAGANLVDLSVPGTWRAGKPWPEMRAHLAKLIHWAERAGLFVIVSFRTGPGRSEGDLTPDGPIDRSVFNDKYAQDAYASMWREVATEYRGNRNVVGYDLLVEPHDTATWPLLAQKLVDTIRAVDSETAVIVGAPEWSHASALTSFAPLQGAHLAYAVHQYEPYAYTHEKAATWTEAELAAAFAPIDAFAGVVVVNEFGAANAKSPEPFLRAELEHLERRGLDHAVWLWEVEDPSGYRAFDVRSAKDVLPTLKDVWSRNTTYACR